ncbi:hypothetical protein [Calidithermus timidus]|jgi:hypothetical protein|nr:hypothetical protein [Calidithermus timidus]
MRKSVWVLMVLGVLLAACGGGGGGTPPASDLSLVGVSPNNP